MSLTRPYGHRHSPILLAEGSDTFSARYAALPIELRSIIEREVLFGPGSYAGDEVEELVAPSYSADLRLAALCHLHRHNRNAYDMIHVRRSLEQAFSQLDTVGLVDVMRGSPGLRKDLLELCRGRSFSQALYSSHSVDFLSRVLDLLLNDIQGTLSDDDELVRDVMRRMLLYCVREEHAILIEQPTSSLAIKTLFGLSVSQLQPLCDLERRLRARLFDWRDTERLTVYHAKIGSTAWSHHNDLVGASNWLAQLTLPLIPVMALAWFFSNALIRMAAWCLTVSLTSSWLLLLGLYLRRVVRKLAVDHVYLRSRSPMLVHSTSVPRSSKSSVVKHPAPSLAVQSRRSLSLWPWNEIRIRNASKGSILVSSYNAADHYFMVTPITQTVISSRCTDIVFSTWDLRGTRVHVQQCREKRDEVDEKTDERSLLKEWERGSRFNLYAKRILLVPKSSQLTVTDDDFV
ncbi:hypothetical protein FA10DRAFT_266686 [Acaromyces ingoldii]|uniref:Uncharacterized protein n=1 Tax=Acaromyces ingoldii TaxID=215250 RepID=A0A316YLE0_9BASI|nr:hypothetical protein FA10DRAFT_266686 [Acaromyces ingoldii]PWN90197.1 hypothetical protein FA10DRAFT_266686 [Acaromyces ingoldii]